MILISLQSREPCHKTLHALSHSNLLLTLLCQYFNPFHQQQVIVNNV